MDTYQYLADAIKAIALKTPGEGLSDNSDRIRQHGVRGQVLALIDVDKDWVADGGAD
jgi:hypothetical protein